MKLPKHDVIHIRNNEFPFKLKREAQIEKILENGKIEKET